MPAAISPHDQPIDLAIIGAGPVGLYAAFYAGLRQMKVTIFDSLDALGGQLVTLYPEKFIYDVAGFPKILAKDLAANLIEQGLQYGAQTRLGRAVEQLDYHAETRLYTLATGDESHPARSVLICGGVGSFRPKTLPIQGVARFQGHGLHYFVKELEAFKASRILIVGGGDSAVDWANMLSPLAATLTVIHRRDQFRAHEDSVAKMRAGRARVLTPYELKAIEGEDGVQSAVIFDNRTKEETRLAVDHVLVNIGFETSLGPIARWGLELERGQIRVNSFMQTSRPGIFAAGDICAYPGKLKLIATGFGEAAIAVNHAKQHLDPSAKLFPGHSSEMKR